MSTMKLSEKLLKKFVCAECGNYLSKAPIYIRTDGDNICSRCVDHTCASVVVRCKLLEELASLHSFPCRYRAQGCPEHILFNKEHTHEINCTYRTYPCPVGLYSSCTWAGALSDIHRHYKKCHPELRLRSPSFKIDFDNDYEAYYLAKIDGLAFLLQIKYLLMQTKLRFSAVHVGDVETASFVTYKIKLSSDDSGRVMELQDEYPKPATHTEMVAGDSVEVNMNALLSFLQYPSNVYCSWCFSIPDELKISSQVSPSVRHRMAENDTSNCPNCGFPLAPPAYRCELGHLTCANCKGYKDVCGTCRKSGVEFSRALDVEDAVQSVLFYCRWRDCLRSFGCYEILQHEQECPRRQYKCPECDEDVGEFDGVIEHFRDTHKEMPIEVAASDCSVNLSVKGFVTYVLVCSELFKIEVFIDQVYMWTIEIEYCGPPALSNCWRYEIRDCYNVLYYPSRVYSNGYQAKQMYEASNLRSQYCLSVKFVRNKKTDLWMPLDCPPRKRARHS